MQSDSRLLHLPEELRLDIWDRLDKSDLSSLNLTSRACYKAATPRIWRDVELVDCRRLTVSPSSLINPNESDFHVDNNDDEHDDTRIIGKLLIILNNPLIATSVTTLTHRCHLPPPSLFEQLPTMSFSAQTLSFDPRTIKLIQLAARAMTRVTTLQLILGHPNMTDALLRCFFDVRRASVPEITPIRRLWLENCRISIGLNPEINSHPYGLPLRLSFSGLQSIRLRRLPLYPGTPFNHYMLYNTVVPTRDGPHQRVTSAMRGTYITSIIPANVENRVGEEHIRWLSTQQPGVPIVRHGASVTATDVTDRDRQSPLERFFKRSMKLDDIMWDAIKAKFFLPPQILAAWLPHHERATVAYRGNWLDPLDLAECTALPAWKRFQRERVPSARLVPLVLANASATLTSINFDWILNVDNTSLNGPDLLRRIAMFRSLLQLRFPALRAFQWRNAVSQNTMLPDGLYLFDRWVTSLDHTNSIDDAALAESYAQHHGLDFMEAHAPRLKCLAWPAKHFFAARQDPDEEIRRRIEDVVSILGSNLVDLRVDALYTGLGEPRDDRVSGDLATSGRLSRRRFIAQFASKMSQLTSLKIEGGIPQDERREIVRALHACPLEKLVLIGLTSSLGNTWGAFGADLDPSTPVWDFFGYDGMYGEDRAIVRTYAEKALSTLVKAEQEKVAETEISREPRYGWTADDPPMLYNIALHHRATIKELKFCGYRGAAVLLSPTAITTDLLAPLKCFYSLERLTMSLVLTTHFEGESRDEEVVSYWHDAQSPTSTAIARVVDGDEDGEVGTWEWELKTKYAPARLADRVTALLAPHLSDDAKSRRDGVEIRASFTLGTEGGTFDLDFSIKRDPAIGQDVFWDVVGPRDELESERRTKKLDTRRWF